jgi:hypothetical protein
MKNKRQIYKKEKTSLQSSAQSKKESIVAVIKRLVGEHITSMLIRMQNRELTFRCGHTMFIELFI